MTRDECFSLSNEDGKIVSRKVPELCSTQEEADTEMILHCQHAAADENFQVYNIIVRSPDTDVFVLLLHFQDQIPAHLYFDTGFGDKRRLIDIAQIIEAQDEFPKYIIGLHSMTGCDSTSAFVHKGKIKPFKLCQSNTQFQKAFEELGNNENITQSVQSMLETFVCSLYGDQKESNINKLRYRKAKE